jgi:hypothetical protein
VKGDRTQPFGATDCYVCGAPATCFGRYEGDHEPVQFGCDTHCGHGNEDGWCEPVFQEVPDASLVANASPEAVGASGAQGAAGRARMGPFPDDRDPLSFCAPPEDGFAEAIAAVERERDEARAALAAAKARAERTGRTLADLVRRVEADLAEYREGPDNDLWAGKRIAAAQTLGDIHMALAAIQGAS